MRDFADCSELLLDANLLLLYVVGSADRERITRFKRTDKFLPEDFDLLKSIMGGFRGLVTTPNVIAEVSNLLGQAPGALHEQLFRAFAGSISIVREEYVASVAAAATPIFLRLGITDAGISILAERECAILSDDLPLVLHLEQRGLPTRNFTLLRRFGIP